jgi:hypothetical protein
VPVVVSVQVRSGRRYGWDFGVEFWEADCEGGVRLDCQGTLNVCVGHHYF